MIRAILVDYWDGTDSLIGGFQSFVKQRGTLAVTFDDVRAEDESCVVWVETGSDCGRGSNPEGSQVWVVDCPSEPLAAAFMELAFDFLRRTGLRHEDVSDRDA